MSRTAMMKAAATFAAAILSAPAGAAIEQWSSSPRLREGGSPAQMPRALGGGEVVLELTIDARGRVTRIDRLRITPPYTDAVVSAAAGWRFDPATSAIDGRASAVAGSVLLVALFRPSTFYAAPSLGVAPQVLGAPSARVPRIESAILPAYPPRAIGDGTVLVEIELSGRAEPRGYRIVSPSSGFDNAALDAVRAWRFEAPQAVGLAEPTFAYALLGFRAPIAPSRRPPL